jgi:deoxyribodipyrimidine photo-lyase
MPSERSRARGGGVTAPVLVWLRRDLRLADNPALLAAAELGGPVIPVFVWSPDEDGAWSTGAASRVWLHHSLSRLEDALRQRHTRLVVRSGDAGAALEELIVATGAREVYFNRRYAPAAVERDAKVETRLRARGATLRSFKSGLLFEPHEVLNRADKPYRVFTAFWKRCQARPPPAAALSEPGTLIAPDRWPDSRPIAALGLLPDVDWTEGIRGAWRMGEAAARESLESFLDGAAADYAQRRDYPGGDGVSRLSPHLHFGELSPRQIWHAVREGVDAGAAQPFLRQLAWREFAHHLLFHFPHTTEAPLDERFAQFPWRRGGEGLHAWQRGRTGYPLVDAGMRELWTTGWMHNRARMVVASFLVKHLLVHWLEGARWFWDTLVDADLANNTLGWQWTAGCGADAAPFFRIFNPVAQGERFDADGRYVRRWVPALARLPNRWIHRPWEAPPDVLAEAGVRLDENYPRPIVDHAAARARALDAWGRARER